MKALMKEDPMTTYDFRPAGAALGPRAAPRRGRPDASRGPRGAARAVLVAASVGTLLGVGPTAASARPELRPAIVFTSNRDHPTIPIAQTLGAEIYVMLMKPDGTPDGTAPRRLTSNGDGDSFPVPSPDGKKIVFESNRLSIGNPDPDPDPACNPNFFTWDLFLMEPDGTAQKVLTRGSSASWSPDGKRIVFHASASGTALGRCGGGGVPTSDSDLFVANVDDLHGNGKGRTNLTNTPGHLDYDADWSPVGKQIAFVRHPKHGTSEEQTKEAPNPPDAEIYVINEDGTGLRQLTFNSGGTAAPDWSPDGKRIAFMCKPVSAQPMEICVMNADGTGVRPLTENTVLDGTPIWSPDGSKILFGRQVVAPGTNPPRLPVQLFVMNPDEPGPGLPTATQLTHGELTNPPTNNLFASWGMLRVTP
jgi:TolB protein